jgi:hypothetical protein
MQRCEHRKRGIEREMSPANIRMSYLGFSIQKKCLFAFKFSELLLKKGWDASFLALSKEKGEIV